MSEVRTQNFINVLLEKTLNNTLRWNKIQNYLYPAPFPFYDRDNTYFIEYNNGIIFLVKHLDAEGPDYMSFEHFAIYIQLDANSHVVKKLVHEDGFQEELTKLNYYAYKQHPNLEDFLDAFIEEYNG